MNGVVAEFNPFHNGHKYQIDEIKKKNDKINIAVLSSNLVQRGEFSILDKFLRAKMAILCGYDIVVELPVYYSVQNAEIFATMSTKILSEMGVSTQYFGTENSIEEIEKSIEIIKENDEKIEKFLKRGINYKQVIHNILNNDTYKSNNILAMEYIKSIKRNNLNMNYENILRIGDYNDGVEKNIASASYIRKNYKKISMFIPKICYNLIKEKQKKINSHIYYNLLKYKVLTERYNLLNIYDVNYSLLTNIITSLEQSNTFEEYEAIKNYKHISKNRINRLEKNILLNITKDVINKDDDIKYIRILALNEKGAKYIKALNNSKIFSNWKDIDKKFKNDKLIKIEKDMFLLNKLLLDIDEYFNNIFVKKEEYESCIF